MRQVVPALFILILGFLAGLALWSHDWNPAKAVVDEVVDRVPENLSPEALRCIGFCGEWAANEQTKTIHLMGRVWKGERVNWDCMVVTIGTAGSLRCTCLFEPYQSVTFSLHPEEKLLRQVNLTEGKQLGQIVRVKGVVNDVNPLGAIIVVDKSSDVEVLSTPQQPVP